MTLHGDNVARQSVMQDAVGQGGEAVADSRAQRFWRRLLDGMQRAALVQHLGVRFSAIVAPEPDSCRRAAQPEVVWTIANVGKGNPQVYYNFVPAAERANVAEVLVRYYAYVQVADFGLTRLAETRYLVVTGKYK